MSAPGLTLALPCSEVIDRLLVLPGQAGWVLTEFASAAGLEDLVTHINCHRQDAEAVAAFWRGFADLIEAGGPSE